MGRLPLKAGWWNAPRAFRDFSRSNKQEDSYKELPWFPAFPPMIPRIPILIPLIPTPTLCIPTLISRVPTMIPCVSTIPSFRSPIPHSGFYR